MKNKTKQKTPNKYSGEIRARLGLLLIVIINCIYWGTGIRGLMRGMATLPQGNQELLVVTDKVGRLPGELGISKSVECDIFPSVL